MNGEPLAVEPLGDRPDATVALPGSKSITNRALVCAGLAAGTSRLLGALEADDTAAMVDGLASLGVDVGPDWTVEGCSGRPPAGVAIVDARLSGTTSRFLLPVAALTAGTVRVDGGLPLRTRPMAPSIEAVRRLGALVSEVGEPGHLPVDVSGGPAAGGRIAVAGRASSQFLSGLLLAGPAMRTGLRVEVDGELVSRPYVHMTVAVMAAFGVTVETPDDSTWVVEPQQYQAATYRIEPDASAASYAFAVAAVTGGTITVKGLGPGSLQGDVRFVEVLEQMGATVTKAGDAITVTGPTVLRGVDVDMADISDTAQTLAVVASFADSPSRITGIGFIRGKETDRIRAVASELNRAGITAIEDVDGWTIAPGPARPALIETYDDHRMAMAFALLGLRHRGIRIADPGCVAKTFPGYWAMLDDLRAGRHPAASLHRP